MTPEEEERLYCTTGQIPLRASPSAGLREVDQIFSNSVYPVAASGPVGRYYLRPLRGCKFDTEVYERDAIFARALSFFRNPISTLFQHDRSTKDCADTNMNQCAMLDYPNEAEVLGFNVFLENGIAPEDRAALINGGLFQFTFGPRVYFERPLNAFPSVMPTPDFATAYSEFAKKVAKLRAEARKAAYGSADGAPLDNLIKKLNSKSMLDRFAVVPFNVGDNLFRIKPGEAFGALIKWNELPKTSKPIRITVVIEANLWLPM